GTSAPGSFNFSPPICRIFSLARSSVSMAVWGISIPTTWGRRIARGCARLLRRANSPASLAGHPLACRVEPFEVLPQQVLAVVVAVRCADHDVDMELLRLVVVQEHALVHVKLDEQEYPLKAGHLVVSTT